MTMVKSLGLQDVGTSTCRRCTCGMCQEVDMFLDDMSSSTSYDGFPPRSPSSSKNHQQHRHVRTSTLSSRYNNLPPSSQPQKNLMQPIPPGLSEAFEIDRRWPSEYLSNRRESRIHLSKTHERSSFNDPLEERLELHRNENYSICPHMMLPDNSISTQCASKNAPPTTIGNTTCSNRNALFQRRRNIQSGNHTSNHPTRQVVVNDEDMKPSSCPNFVPTQLETKPGRTPMKRRCSITKFSLEKHVAVERFRHHEETREYELDKYTTNDMMPIPRKNKDNDDNENHIKPNSCPHLIIKDQHIETHDSHSGSKQPRFQRRCSVTKFSLDVVQQSERQDENMHYQWEHSAKSKGQLSNHRPQQVPPPPPSSNSEPFKADDLLVVTGMIKGSSSSPASRHHTPLAGSSSRKRRPTTKVGRAA